MNKMLRILIMMTVTTMAYSSVDDWLLESSAKPLDIDTSQSVVICYEVCVVYGG